MSQPTPAPHEDHPLLRGLNAEQAAAVAHVDGPLLVLAGAGSGKTRVITHRIAWLVHEAGVRPWQILAVTFSNKAAGEMRERVDGLLDGDAGELWLGTFHRIGVRLLRSIGEHAGIARSFSIYDTDDQLRVIKRVMKAEQISDKVFKPRAIASYIDRAKNRCQLPNDPDLPTSDVFDRNAAVVYRGYDAELRRADAVDFGDLLMRPVQILANEPELRAHWSQRFRHILVDEFQDTNHAQYELLKLLSATHGNLCVVGDDDQSIYSWRGAEVRNILDFPVTFPGARVIKLERNYRSTGNVLAASDAVVSTNRGRHGKTLWTDVGDGSKIVLHDAFDDRAEADWLVRTVERLVGDGHAYSDIAVFYRTNAQSRVLEEALRTRRTPYAIIGGQRFYERAEVKDALAYCRLLVNRQDTAAWLRVINTPRRGIGNTTVDAVVQHASRVGMALPDAANDLVKREPGLRNIKKVASFQRLIGEMRDAIAGLGADEAIRHVLEASGLRRTLEEENTPEAEARVENLEELIAAMADHASRADDRSLAGFLEQVALVADTDKLGDKADAVSLMTMHSAKGLEYDVTFVVGLEEGLMPHANSQSNFAIEEECRLLYVGMTRARQRMHLSYARRRRRFGGREEQQTPSRFLRSVPEELLEIQGGGALGLRAGYGAAGHGSGGERYGGGYSIRSRPRVARAMPQRAADGRGWLTGRADHGQSDGEDEPVVQRPATGGFVAGGKARHKAFGVGQILDVSGEGATARVTVEFPRVGIKKVIGRFLKPA